MEEITSRRNPMIRRFRTLGVDRSARRSTGEFVCDGRKLLEEALLAGVEIRAVLWAETPALRFSCPEQYAVPRTLLDYASPLKNAGEVLFLAKMGERRPPREGRALVLESVQDPGNLGTILRSADALGMEHVLLTGDCADPYNPKAVRASMGAVFRQDFWETDFDGLDTWLNAQGKRLYGAALEPEAVDVRTVELSHAVVAVGSEGRGLSKELLSRCAGTLKIPMRPRCESLNAAAAAAILMWEMVRREGE